MSMTTVETEARNVRAGDHANIKLFTQPEVALVCDVAEVQFDQMQFVRITFLDEEGQPWETWNDPDAKLNLIAWED